MIVRGCVLIYVSRMAAAVFRGMLCEKYNKRQVDVLWREPLPQIALMQSRQSTLAETRETLCPEPRRVAVPRSAAGENFLRLVVPGLV